jgi:hypothetical protein
MDDRSMSPLTGVLTEAWSYYRRYAGHFLAISFTIYLVAAVIEALLTAFASTAGYVLAAIVGYVALFLVEAALVKAVQDVQDGRVDLDFAETVSAGLPYVLPVALASILAAIATIIGLAFLIVPGLVLLTFWSLIVPCIVIEQSGPFGSFGLSWRTVRGYAWRVFGTYVLVILIWIAFIIVIGLILLAIPSAIRNFVSSIVSGTLFAPFLALVVTLIYYRLTAAHAQAGGPGGYGQYPPPGSGHTPPPGSGHTPPPGSGHTPPPGSGHTPPPGSGHTPPPGTGYPGPGGTQPPPPPPSPGGHTEPGDTQPQPPPGTDPEPPPEERT